MHINAYGENYVPFDLETDSNGLRDKLLTMDGVNSVACEKEIIKISCERDLSSAIAKSIVESGIELNSLHKREYGLDDIYQRYFEKEEVR